MTVKLNYAQVGSFFKKRDGSMHTIYNMQVKSKTAIKNLNGRSIQEIRNIYIINFEIFEQNGKKIIGVDTNDDIILISSTPFVFDELEKKEKDKDEKIEKTEHVLEENESDLKSKQIKKDELNLINDVDVVVNNKHNVKERKKI